MTAETDKDREGAAEAAALDKVTDLVPEKQLDEGKVREAMADMAAAQKANKEAQRKREKELAAVKVKRADIELICREFEIEDRLAERRLRECNANVVEALKSFL
ncbi:hypothetical protein BSKO_13273 [Bryopsis sp. KO-2023]|nr:hypothetical protein BSKO_13273 [Bryopsis sp. KO-2023]